MHSDHSKGKDNFKFSVAQFTDARFSKIKLNHAVQKTAPSTCHRTVLETEFELGTSEFIPKPQEASCNFIELNIRQHIQTPARETFTIKLEDLNSFEMVPTINVSTDGRQKPIEPAEPMLVRFTDPVVIKQQEYLIDQVVGNEPLLSSRVFQQSTLQDTKQAPYNRNHLPALQYGPNAQLDFENISGSPSQEIVKIYLEKKEEVDKDPDKSLLEYQRIEFRKKFEMLSAILEEVGRMNDYYMKDIIDKSEEASAAFNFVSHMQKGVQIMDGLSSFLVPVHNEEGEPYCLLNVLEFGSTVLRDSVTFLINVEQFLTEYNKFRTKFHEFSEDISSYPLEQLIGSKHNDKIDEIVELSKTIYKKFFEDEKYHSHFKNLEIDHIILQHQVDRFDIYLKKLAAQNN